MCLRRPPVEHAAAGEGQAVQAVVRVLVVAVLPAAVVARVLPRVLLVRRVARVVVAVGYCKSVGPDAIK